MSEPVGIVVDKSGNVYVADTGNNRIQKFDENGTPVAQWPVPMGSWDVEADAFEAFLALDNEGNIYSTAPASGSVFKLDPNGKLLATKSKQGSITLNMPTGIAVWPDGTVYVADAKSSAIVNGHPTSSEH